MTSSQDTWALVRLAYCETTEPVSNICARFGVGQKGLYRRINADGWGKRSANPAYVHPFKRSISDVTGPSDDSPLPELSDLSHAAAPAKPSKVHKSGKGPAKRRTRLTSAQKRTKAALALRLYNALDLKLTQLEDLMERGDEKTTIDQGRQTRAISQLIKAFERVTEYDPGLLKSASIAGLAPGTVAAYGPATDAAAGANGSATDSPSSPAAPGTEQRRREIAERLERIIAKRIAAAGSDSA